MQLLQTLNEQAKEVELINSDRVIFESLGFNPDEVLTYKALLEVSMAASARAGERDWISDLAKDKEIYKPRADQWRSPREDMVDIEPEGEFQPGASSLPKAGDLVVLPGGRLANILRVDGVEKSAIYPSGTKVTVKVPTGTYVVDSSKFIPSPRKSVNPDKTIWALANK